MGDGSVLASSVKREALLSVPGGGFESGQANVHRTDSVAPRAGNRRFTHAARSTATKRD